jgi:hypothetical protein
MNSHFLTLQETLKELPIFINSAIAQQDEGNTAFRMPVVEKHLTKDCILAQTIQAMKALHEAKLQLLQQLPGTSASHHQKSSSQYFRLRQIRRRISQNLIVIFFL